MSKKLFLLPLFPVIIIIVVYLKIDHSVSKQLNSSNGDKLSAVFSDSIRITSGALLPASSLKARLASRDYVPVLESPKSPGEYRLSDTKLNVITRGFRAGTDHDIPSAIITYDLTTGEVLLGDQPVKSFELEPIPLAALGGGTVRASRNLTLNEIPEIMQEAVIAIEDKRFYQHFGIDLIGLMRAVFENLKSLRFVQGGSTLTQQLAKNTLFTPRKTLGRKFMEMFAALSLEHHLPKEKILEMYLNEIYLGQEGSTAIHGVEEASQSFFGKSVKEITPSEAALLAGMIQAPSAYSPRRNFDRAIERRNVVLHEMRQMDVLGEEQLKKALNEKIHIRESFAHKRIAPFYVSHVEQILSDRFNVEAASMTGLQVFTGIDPELQACAEQAVAAGVKRLEKTYPALQKRKNPIQQALVAIEPFSGKIKAWVGGRDFGKTQFDRVSQAKRQIGSTIKPFLYLTAMDKTLNTYKVATPLSILSDEPTQIDLPTKTSWHPENYDHQYHGDVTLRYALEHSLNLPAVYVAERVGIPAIVKTAQRFRLSDTIPNVPALALGALDTTLLRLTASYGALANGGIYVSPRIFLEAINAEGEQLAAPESLEEKIVDDGPVYVLTDILRGVIDRGTANIIRKIGFQREAAGKTGTSDDARDAWFVGFVPNLVTGVWTGLDNNQKMGITGGVASAPVWADFMKCANSYVDEMPFLPPPSVISVPIDSESRQRAMSNCPPENIVREIFIQGTEPQRECPLHSNDLRDREDYREDRSDDEYRPRDRGPKQGGLWESIFGR